jgi:nickel/cobalt transporter (NicO) family protein
MPDFFQAIQNGSQDLWLFIPAFILLGAFHGLEPGHSKTMMAAFIIAIRGTMAQAVLLGLSAALSHSFIIAVLAAAALHLGSRWNTETIEPYLQLGSAAAIIALAVWMFLRTRRELREAHDHHHNHHHGHDHDHHDHPEKESLLLDTGHGKIELSVFEDGVPPVFRLRAPAGEPLPAVAGIEVETLRPDGGRQVFAFASKDGFLESRDSIPEPHAFDVALTVIADGIPHTARAEFREDEHHSHAAHCEGHEYQDAHELEHASDIRQRFHGRTVTTPQIVLFGVTGGLIPCPAAFSILLVCLQFKRVALGAVMVASFSFGLALTMVAVGVIAAWSVQHAQRKFRGFGDAMRRAPYVSCVVLVILAATMAWRGWHGLRGL